MKKALIALALAGFASTASATIANSKHDLNQGGLGYNGFTPVVGACNFCHAPHSGNTNQVTGATTGTGVTTGFGQIPLWNRRQPAGTGYTLRTTTQSPTPHLGAGSYMCLSCHDGTSDLGQLYNGKGFSQAGVMTIGNGAPIAANVGLVYNGTSYVAGVSAVDLTDDHPVGVVYAGGTGYNSATSVDNGTTSRTLKLYANAFGGGVTVECGSCHDPHQTWPTGKNFMRINPAGAVDLCGVCHTK